MFNSRPVCLEVKVRTIWLRMTLSAANGGCHKAIAFRRRCRMVAPRPVTGFALNIGELRSGHKRLEPALVKPDDVAANALVVELLALAFESGHSMGMARLLPHSILVGVAARAG